MPWSCSVLLLFLSTAALCQEWQRDRVKSVRIHYEAQNSSAVTVLKPVISEALDHISQELELSQVDSADLYLSPDRRTFHARTGGRIPEWGAGCAFPAQGRMYVHLEHFDSDALKRTIVHELAHIAVYRKAAGKPLPRWFDEGISMWLARDWQYRQTLDLSLALLSDRIHSLSEVEALLVFPEAEARRAYAESLSAVLFLRELGGRLIWADLLAATANTGSFEQALSEILSMSSGAFDEAWRSHVRSEFNAMSLLADSTVLWLSVVGLAVVAYILTRIRAHQLVETWNTEEDEETKSGR